MVTNEGKAGSKRSICYILHPTTDKTWGGEPGQKKYSTMIKKNYHCLNICKSLLCKGEDLMCVHSFIWPGIHIYDTHYQILSAIHGLQVLRHGLSPLGT